jgi:hypothetical protein
MRDDDRLLRRLEADREAEGAPPAATADAARLDPTLEARLDRWRAIAHDLEEHGVASFGPAFRVQVLERIRAANAGGETALYGHLRWMFMRVAFAGVAAALVLGAYNASAGYESAGTVVENVFGLPTPDLEAAMLLAGNTP